MRSASIASALVLGLTLSARSAAAPSFVTIWAFSVNYGNGTIIQDTDPANAAPIAMPVGSRWKCKRAAVAMTPGGLLIGGYTCTDGPTLISIQALCSATKADDSNTHVELIETGLPKGLSIGATCKTFPSKASP